MFPKTKTKSSNNHTIFVVNNKITMGKEIISKGFSQYFTSIGTNLRGKLDYDDLARKLLKTGANEIATPLMYLVNKSLCQGMF